MSRVIRSRRAGLSRDQVRQQPLYARLLGLQYLAPSGFLCFVFLEGAIVLGILLALAELVSWWGVLVLPITVAVMVKLNDVVAGILARPSVPVAAPSGSAGSPVLRPPVVRPPASDDRPTVVGQRPPGGRRASVARTGADLDGREPAERPDGWRSGAREDLSLGRATTVDLRGRVSGGQPPMGAGAINGPTESRRWSDRQQWLRQSATKRYE
jgi:hypothetical protein